ncbi:tetratricopeptide repeat protein [Cupriavidus sp. 30B13]|uniref:tetratricopeptide repeat protein n=1 Tax=Cupriavidus sp. 30B13 TaxID=3384241 RepID=UPI003B9010A1
MPTYTMREAQALLGISRATAARLIAAGIVKPARGARREYLFTFRDMVMLRTAHSLRAANIPSRRIVRALARLQASRGDGQPLSGVRVSAVGNQVAVREGGLQWQAESGQLLMDFGPREERREATVAPLPLPPQPAAHAVAAGHFETARGLEARGPAAAAAAEAAYRQAIAAFPGYLDAYLNLGCLLCDAGRYADAAALYRAALAHLPGEALIHFNLAVALEDGGHPREALAGYERCIALLPDFADAHFNAARLYQELGNARGAIRHFNQYRKLQPRS